MTSVFVEFSFSWVSWYSSLSPHTCPPLLVFLLIFFYSICFFLYPKLSNMLAPWTIFLKHKDTLFRRLPNSHVCPHVYISTTVFKMPLWSPWRWFFFRLYKTNLYKSLATQSDSESKREKPGIQMNLHILIALCSAWPRVDLRTVIDREMDRVMNVSSALNTHFICKAYIGILSVND